MSDRKSVLFVDDEMMLLDGLRRSLRPLRGEWECEFADSGRRALELLAARHFDVLVTDMMMPEMNGVELLDQVRRRHPKVVRFVLSGHADLELIRRCVASTHRFLSKPCDFDSLKAALDRATSLSFMLRNEPLAALVARMDRLPSPPEVCQELDRRLQCSGVSLEEIGAIIARDMALTAQVLKLANSAFFGLAREIETPGEAVSYLGIETIRTLTLCLHVNKRMTAMGLSTELVERLWRHSLRVSICARRLAELEQATPAIVKEATTAGLLHDAGKLIMMLNFPDQTRRATEAAAANRVLLSTAERDVFQCTHADVGGYLFALWGLPLPVVKAVAWHHAPLKEESRTFTATTAVHVADVLVHERDGESEGGIPVPFVQDYLDACRLTARIPDWRARAFNDPGAPLQPEMS